mmetsp:Transcript_38928/g.70235  ORF Transcript_38928/g.70235 Transcript_38928/m.70235 type:complete len:343 (+) Transcript_38928:19-1047(+)
MARRRLSSAVVEEEDNAWQPWWLRNKREGTESLMPVLPEGTSWRQDNSGKWIQQKYDMAYRALAPLASAVGKSFPRTEHQEELQTRASPSRSSSKERNAGDRRRPSGRASSKQSNSSISTNASSMDRRSSVERRGSVSSVSSAGSSDTETGLRDERRLSLVSNGNTETRRLSSLYKAKPNRRTSLPPLQGSTSDVVEKSSEVPSSELVPERSPSKSVTFEECHGDDEACSPAMMCKRASRWTAVQDLVLGENVNDTENSSACPVPPASKPTARQQRLRRLREFARQVDASQTECDANFEPVPSSPQRTEAERHWKDFKESAEEMADVSFDQDFALPHAELLL